MPAIKKVLIIGSGRLSLARQQNLIIVALRPVKPSKKRAFLWD